MVYHKVKIVWKKLKTVSMINMTTRKPKLEIKMALTMTDISMYIPTFDENTGKYIDVCPYKFHERQRKHYTCRCNVSTIITSRQQFLSHVKSKTHQELLKNHEMYYKELDDATNENKQYRVENELLKRKLEQREKSNNQVNKSLKEKALEFTKTITDLREKNIEYMSKITALSKKEDSMNNQIEIYKSQIENKNEQINNLKTELLNKIEQINHLESELTEQDDDYQDIMNFE